MPDVTISTPVAGALVTYPFTATGTATPGSTVELRDDFTGDLLGWTVADAVTGAWSITVTGAVAQPPISLVNGFETTDAPWTYVGNGVQAAAENGVTPHSGSKMLRTTTAPPGYLGAADLYITGAAYRGGTDPLSVWLYLLGTAALLASDPTYYAAVDVLAYSGASGGGSLLARTDVTLAGHGPASFDNSSSVDLSPGVWSQRSLDVRSRLHAALVAAGHTEADIGSVLVMLRFVATGTPATATLYFDDVAF